MIAHKENGWLVPYGDEGLLREALITLSREPELRTEFAENGRKIVASRLNADRFIAELEDFFTQYGRPAKEQVRLRLAEN